MPFEYKRKQMSTMKELINQVKAEYIESNTVTRAEVGVRKEKPHHISPKQFVLLLNRLREKQKELRDLEKRFNAKRLDQSEEALLVEAKPFTVKDINYLWKQYDQEVSGLQSYFKDSARLISKKRNDESDEVK